MHSGDNDFRGDSCRDGGHRIEISGRDRIPREMGFSGPIYQTRSAIDPPSRGTFAVRASEASISSANLSITALPGAKQITASTDVDNSTKARKAGMLRTQITRPGNSLGFSLAIRQHHAIRRALLAWIDPLITENHYAIPAIRRCQYRTGTPEYACHAVPRSNHAHRQRSSLRPAAVINAGPFRRP